MHTYHDEYCYWFGEYKLCTQYIVYIDYYVLCRSRRDWIADILYHIVIYQLILHILQYNYYYTSVVCVICTIHIML